MFTSAGAGLGALAAVVSFAAAPAGASEGGGATATLVRNDLLPDHDLVQLELQSPDPPEGVLAAIGALIGVVAVVAVAAIVRRPLSRVPENQLAFAVGVMLTSFGIFWSGEGAGVDWPGGDSALLGLIAVTAAWALTFVAVLERRGRLEPESAA